ADSVLIVDNQGHILQANAADRTMLGYDAHSTHFTATLRERRARLLPRDEHGQPIAEDQLALTRILRGETLSGQHESDVTIRTSDGCDIQVRTSGAPIVDGKGAVIGGVAVTRDVTAHRRRERALWDANRRMDEVLAVAAHDLRTPISASQG